MPRLTLNRAPATMDGRRVSLSGEVIADYACALGATSEPENFAATLAAFPGVRYVRDYGLDDGQYVTPHGTRKLALMPAGSIVHCSIKGDIEQVGPWLASAPGHLFYHWTYHHEPVGDPGMTAAGYRSTGQRLAEIIAESPNAHLVLGNGPCVTRWNLLEGVDPAQWMPIGATHLYGDTYSQNATRYLTFDEQFGPIRDAAARLGVRWGVPEYGMRLLTSDANSDPAKSGIGRAAAIRAHFADLVKEPDLDCVGWWDRGGCRLRDRHGCPDGAALREVLT